MLFKATVYRNGTRLFHIAGLEKLNNSSTNSCRVMSVAFLVLKNMLRVDKPRMSTANLSAYHDNL